MRQTCVEPLPNGRYCVDIVRKIQAPIAAREDLLRIQRIREYRVDRHIGKIAGLVLPCERSAIRSAGHPKNVARLPWCVLFEPTNRGIPDQGVYRISGDIEDCAIG